MTEDELENPIKITCNEVYKAALREASVYFDNEPDLNTPKGRRFERLLKALIVYEEKHFPLS